MKEMKQRAKYFFNESFELFKIIYSYLFVDFVVRGEAPLVLMYLQLFTYIYYYPHLFLHNSKVSFYRGGFLLMGSCLISFLGGMSQLGIVTIYNF